MGKKKSESDLLRIEHFQREVKRRNALKGPFRCPSCFRDKSLHVHINTVTKKESYTPPMGDPREIVVEYTQHVFSCRGCDFKKIIMQRGGRDIIGLYNNLYDDEISERAKIQQINMIRDSDFRKIKLPACEVKMR